MPALDAVALVLLGLLAGGEVIVRFGVQPALSRLAGSEAIRARQALIARLRWLVPAIALPAFVTTVLAAIVTTSTAAAEVGPGPEPDVPTLALRWAAVGSLVVFWIVAGVGTVPINIRIIDWDAAAPPVDADAVVRRWARVDLIRCLAAVLALVSGVAAAVLG